MASTTVRLPMTVAARRGVSAVAAAAEEQRVVLTSHGRSIAIVDSAERLDEDVRKIREAALAVTDAASDLVWQRSQKLDLDEVCRRVGVDIEAVRTRAAELRNC